MKYVPISNNPNVSESRLGSSSPSLKIDDRGFPHISWLEEGNGINRVKYSYWDGLKWSFKDTPSVYVSSENIMFSPNSLVLDENYDPHIVFARKLGSGTRLSLANYTSEWVYNTLDVNYDVSWVGVTRQDRKIEYSSSSSSSSSYIENWSSSSTSSDSSSTGSSSSSSSSSYVKGWSSSSSNSSSTSSSSTSSYVKNWSSSSSNSSSFSTNSFSSESYSSSSSTQRQNSSSSSSKSASLSSISLSLSSSSSLSFTSWSSLSLSSSSTSSSGSSNSSSSSSLSSFSSQSSLSTLSSSSSTSSPSSSSTKSSSSSSIDSPSSSSSSSFDDTLYFITLYDSTNGCFRIYSVSYTTREWRLLGTKSAIPSSCIKISSCGRRIGMGFIDEDSNIQCNSFDLRLESWDFSSFTKIVASQTYDNIVDMDLAGYNSEDIGVISISWLSDGNSFVVCHALINNLGTEWYANGISSVIENNTKDVTSSYVVNGYKNIAICTNAELSYIFAMGSANKLFSYSLGWIGEKIDINGISSGIISNSLVSQYDNGVKISLSANSGDIYYFEESADSGFDLATSDIVLSTDTYSYRANYVNGELSGVDITGTNNSICGDILRDSEKPLLISFNQ